MSTVAELREHGIIAASDGHPYIDYDADVAARFKAWCEQLHELIESARARLTTEGWDEIVVVEPEKSGPVPRRVTQAQTRPTTATPDR